MIGAEQETVTLAGGSAHMGARELVPRDQHSASSRLSALMLNCWARIDGLLRWKRLEVLRVKI
jgi:hypothetical protein